MRWLKYFLLILAFIPFTAQAVTTIPWSITNLTDTFIFPNLVNSNAKGILVSASSTINANLSVSTLTAGNCVQAGAGGILTTIVGACGTSGGSITAVTATNPLFSSGGTTPNISTIFSTTSTFGIGADGFIYTNHAGLPVTAASSSFFGYIPVPPTRSITVSGTASQVSVTGGTQDLSADRTWTAALTNHTIFPAGGFESIIASTTNATTSTFAIIGAAANCNGTNALTTSSTGVVGCTAQPQGTVTAVSVASANGLAGSSSGGATPALTLTTTVTANVLKGNGTAISGAVNGTDYTLITAKTCTTGDFVSSVTAAGVFTCTTPTGTTYTGTYPIVVTGSVISSLYSTTTNTGLAQGIRYIGTGGIDQIAASSSIFGYTPEQPLTFNFPLSRSTNAISNLFSTTTNSGMGAGSLYVGSGGIFQTTATGTVSNGTGISVTAGQSVIGSGLTITNTGVTSAVAGTGISVSGATGAVTITNTIGYPFTPVTGGSATTSVLFPAGLITASSTIGKLTATSSLTLPFITSTQCLHSVSGVVSGTGSDCGSGGGGGTFPFTPINGTSVSTSSGLVITASSTIGDGTNGLNVSGSLLSTGNVTVGTAGNFAVFAGSLINTGCNLSLRGGGSGLSWIICDNSFKPPGVAPSGFDYIQPSYYSADVTPGNLLITGPPAWDVSTNRNGGNLYLSGGLPSGTGIGGNVILGYDDTHPLGKVGIGTTSPFANLSIHANNGSTNLVLFAIGSSTASATTTLFQIDNKGHQVTSGTTPSVSGGTSSVAGNDNNGTITVTGTLLTSVTLTFATSWNTAPDCTMADSSTGITGAITSISATQLVVGFSAGINSGTVWYICRGHQ